MADAARAAGRGLSHTFEGETYTLTPLGPDQLALFELWMENNAFAKVERLKGKVDEATYQARLDKVTEQVCANRYAWTGPLAAEVYCSAEGQRYSFYLMLLPCHPDMTPALAAQMFDADPVAVVAKMNATEGNDPNPEAPAETSSAE